MSKSYAISFYLEFFAHVSYSVGALPLDEAIEDANDAEMKGQDSDGRDRNSKEKNGKADSGIDHLSIMYMPCQDPLLVKIY